LSSIANSTPTINLRTHVIALAPDGRTLYAVGPYDLPDGSPSGYSRLVFVDTATFTVSQVNDLPIAGAVNFGQAAVSPDGAELYLVWGENQCLSFSKALVSEVVWHTNHPLVNLESRRDLNMKGLFLDVANRASRYIEGLSERRVNPSSEAVERLKLLDVPLQHEPIEPARVLAELDEIGSPATVASTGGRYFGFVVGGCLPAAMVANLLAGVWDQNAAYKVLSPVAVALEEVCTKWLISLFGLPPGTGVGFVTGATMANFSGLAAARHALLAREGWDVEAQGLFGAPPITVILGEEAHVSVLKALSMLGLGRDRVVRVAADRQGRMRADALPQISGPTIVCIQAGNVNTGAFDPAEEICRTARESEAWVHVDGAFGLWALAAPGRAHLARGIQNADSWATDAHKWLNVPHDSGIALVREPKHLRAAMSASAAYLIAGEGREPCHYVPEFSRRGRGIEIWAALRSLGRSGIADQIERTCTYASQFTEGLRAAGYDILNDVVLNQVLVSFGSKDLTRRVIQRVHKEGTCWFGGTEWQGHVAMRISVSCWATTAEDVQKSLDVLLRIASEEARV
jgi:glutamate/tyrosine decarboxylase-like PLP-dependent enzyme